MKEKDNNQAKPLPYRRVVAKFGTNLLTAGGDNLDLEVMSSLVGQVARLHRQGVEVIIVSSGAVAAGRHKLKSALERKDILFKQVLASVGQSRLMQAYEQLFAWHDIPIAQALLTRSDLSQRLGYLNARNTLLALMELGVVTIVNENDVVAVEELEGATFGDNDNLSAMVANLVDADLLVLLTDTGGLYTADPHLDPKAKLISRVDRIDEKIERLASGSASQRGTGGMITKLEAAKLATASGVAVAIASGREPEVLLRLAEGKAVGTFFSPAVSKLESRQRWILSGLATKGRLMVDKGAAAALKNQDKSLLPVGVAKVEGDFERGELVDILDKKGVLLARGISNYSSRDLAKIKGAHSEVIASLLGYEYGAEVVHRSNLTLM